MKQFLKNFSYTFFSNIFGLIVTALITFGVPKVLGLEQYGYFQLFAFYSTYIGFLHFGWADGIYLRYGGKYYEELDKERFATQFWIFYTFELIIAVVFGIIGVQAANTYEKRTIMIFIACSIALTLPKTFLQYILQSTNRMKEYALANIVEKFFYFLTVMILIFVIRSSGFKELLTADLLGRIGSFAYVVFECRDIIFKRIGKVSSVFEEIVDNIKIGSNLMFANIAGSLIIGVVRLAIEKKWDVITFGKISLTMSISNMLLIVIRAVALVIFPTLRRMDEKKRVNLYEIMRTYLMLPLLGLLVIYYPIRICIGAWLPQYDDSLKYMALLFPICIFESKMSMLIEPYLKTFRREHDLLMVNVYALILSVLTTIIIVFWIGSLDLTVLSIVFFMAYRCILAEKKLTFSIDLNVDRDIILEIVMTVTFMLSNWLVGGWKGSILYFLTYLGYIWIKRDCIFKAIKHVKNV